MDMNKIGFNIRYLMDKKGWSFARVAEECRWENGASRISNYVNTPRVPSYEALEVIAKAFGVYAGDLAYADFSKQKNIPPKFIGTPILDWEDVLDWPVNKNELLTKKTYDYLYAQSSANIMNCYALRVNDDSMSKNIEGKSFPEGSFIIVNPDVLHKHKDFVIVKDENGAIIFREYTKYSSGEYLNTLNTKVPGNLLMNNKIKICGVVIAHFDNLMK